MKKQTMPFDWSKPQRQPLAGLAVAFLNTFWEVLKRFWPLALLMLFGKKGKVDRYEIIGLAVLVITIIAAVFRFFYFRFFIEEGNLIIKKGWLQKQTKIIPLQKIQTVNIEQGPLHQALNIVKLSIDTAGSQKTEATIDALHQSMAEALRQELLSQSVAEENLEQETKRQFNEPIIKLTGKDLLKLSISANHFEAFFILLSFSYALYDNLKNIDNNFFSGIGNFLPEQAIYPILLLIVTVLLITVLVSTIMIFLRFYNFSTFKTEKGFYIKSGLTNIKERLAGLQKIQFISWKANWIRKLMNLWMMEFHLAGGDEAKNDMKVLIPLTQNKYIPLLVNSYYPLPSISEQVFVRMHRSFILRRLLITGMLPATIAAAIFWQLIGIYVLLFLIFPFIVFVVAWCVQKKFRLYALDEVLYIKKGIFGEGRIMMQWHKLQSVNISQSIFQRRKQLANVVIHTAGGNIHINYIPLPAAREVADYMLYKTESRNPNWM